MSITHSNIEKLFNLKQEQQALIQTIKAEFIASNKEVYYHPIYHIYIGPGVTADLVFIYGNEADKYWAEYQKYGRPQSKRKKSKKQSTTNTTEPTISDKDFLADNPAKFNKYIEAKSKWAAANNKNGFNI